MTVYTNLSTDHLTIDDVFSVESAMTADEINDAIENTVDFAREYAEQEIEGKLSIATYPRFGYTTTQVMENEEEYEQWLREVLDEETESFRQTVFALVKAESDRFAKRDALVTSSNVKPECPLCGHEVEKDEFGDYIGCYHFVDFWAEWYHPDENLDDILPLATHEVGVDFDMAGTTYYYFATSDLDNVMTSGEVAEVYGITADTVRQTIARGAIKARKSGNAWLILRSEAERFWNRNAVKGVTTWLLTVLAVLAMVSQL